MVRVMRNAGVWAVALAIPALAVGVSAQGPSPAPAPAGQQPDRYVVGQARPPETPGAPIRELTLEQAIQIALERNLDLKVARMNPQSVDYQIRSARAAFSPTVSSSYSYNNSQQNSASTLDGVSRVVSESQGYNGSFNQTTPWYGGRFTASFNNSRSTTNQVTSRFNPNYDSTLQFRYTQPLLSGFRIDNQRNSLRTLQVQRQIADIQLQTTIENITANVRQAYWTLRQRIEQIEINRRSLELAQQLLEDNRIRVEIGTLAPIETTQPEVQVANAEQALLNSQIQWRTAELNFKRLLVSGPADELYGLTLNPVDQPAFAVQSVDIPGAVTNALANRSDLVQARRNLDVSQMNLEVSKNATMPSLDLTSSYTLRGTGGTLKTSQGTVPGGWLDALGDIGRFETPAWNLSFSFSYPIGMAAAKANYARQVLNLEQAQAQLKSQELTISTDVTNAGLAVENTFKQLQAAQKSREAAERNAEAQATRFEVGMSTNYEVVQAQNQLTSARLSELNAIINYVNAVAEFDRVQRVGR